MYILPFRTCAYIFNAHYVLLSSYGVVIHLPIKRVVCRIVMVMVMGMVMIIVIVYGWNLGI